MNAQYSAISACYDELRGTDYDRWAEYIASLIKRHECAPTSLVLDCACGTGGLTKRLAAFGYDMTGVDISEDMLTVAREVCPPQVLLLKQDIASLELYGTVGAAVCCLDSVNYLTPGAVKAFFACVHNYLDPGGVLIFDVNTKYKFEAVYGGRDYILESPDRTKLLAWSCDYSAARKQCRFLLTLFTKSKDGLYKRDDEEQREYYHSDGFLCRSLAECGLELVCKYGELSYLPPDDGGQRVHYVARCVKG